MFICVHMCMPVCVEARDKPVIIPPGPPISILFVSYSSLFSVSGSLHCLGLHEQARRIGQPQGSAFLCHTRAKVSEYAPPLGRFTWVLGIEPHLSGLHKEHLAN